MTLDTHTIHVLLTAICGVIAVVLIVAWWRERGIHAYLWWSSACLLAVTGLVLLALRGQVSDLVSAQWGNGFLLTAAGLAWAGLKSLYGRPISAWQAFAPAALWLVAGFLFPEFIDDAWERTVWLSLASAALCFAIACEIWSDRTDRLLSSGPLAALVVLNGAFYGLRGAAAIINPVPENLDSDGFWFGMSMVEAILFIVAAAVFAIALLREQNERQLRDLVMLDPLTGALNRRGFFEAAEPLLDSLRASGGMAAMLVVDFDSFKRINDSHGHGAGDAVLTEFRRRVSVLMPEGALICRLGGEEFAMLFPVSSEGEPVFLAERLCAAVSGRPFAHSGVSIHATVSVGVAVQQGDDLEMSRLLTIADHALYDAKGAGRNQVRQAAALR